MKRYYLGFAAHLSGREIWRHTFTVGREKDRKVLKRFLSDKYLGETVLTKNCRSALAMALKAYFKPGDSIMVNGLTCYAVLEAINAARLTPVFVDVNRSDLNMDLGTLWASDGAEESPAARGRESNTVGTTAGSAQKPAGIIVQNTLGNPVDMAAIEKLAREHGLIIIEDLAHSVGVKYPDGREAGMVGAATVLSFGKDKSIDTTSGGAVIFRAPCTAMKGARKILPKDFEPSLRPRVSDTLRARFYPMFGAMMRGLNRVHLGGVLQSLLYKLHWLEKSADNKLELDRKIAKFEAKLALGQLKKLKKSGEPSLREFMLVSDRLTALKELEKAGYYFDGFWYDTPIIPKRYYHKAHFPEESCPVAMELSQKMLNFPTWYNQKDLAPARKIIQKYLEES